MHALLGENGAGKSTLSNILTGLYRPDEGEIFIDGEPVHFHSPRDALDAGICMVHQHFRLVEPFTVAENVVLGDHRGEGRTFRLRHRAIERRVAELSKRYGLAVDPRARVWQLSVGEQQRVEILKALYREARILILDEPTAVLTPQEADVLFETLREMAAEGRTVDLHLAQAARGEGGRRPRHRAARRPLDRDASSAADATPRSLAALMVGRELDAAQPARRTNRRASRCSSSTASGPTATAATSAVRGVVARRARRGDRRRRRRRRQRAARAGGDGRRHAPGDARGDPRRRQGVRAGDPRSAIAAGVAYVPEDRLGTGVAPSLSIASNLALKSLPRARARRTGRCSGSGAFASAPSS